MIAEALTLARVNPFPGLRPFEPDEDYLFFGRERQIDELLRRLRTVRFLAVLGTSGCGKSSLVRSGLIPSLYGGAMTRAGSSWRVAILRPGEDPIANLARALDTPEALGGGGGEDGGLQRAFFETTLRASNLGLVECIRQARMPRRENLLVLVDQLEELFRYKHSRRDKGRDEAVAFVKLLLEASRHREVPVYVALTMRSDFIGNCMEFSELPETVNEGLFLVPRMTRDELQSAIAGPVAVGGGTIAPRLVSRLLNDVGDDPDQLPILQHALMRTWDRWEEDHAPGEPLDLRHYDAVGTMGESLSRHAEEAWGELGAEGQRIAEILFKALTDRGTDGRGVRRPAALGEICALSDASEAEVLTVVDRFRRPGRSFLMPPPGAPLHAASILDISHESLMRIWDRLAHWVDEEARSAQLYLGAARAAARHEEGRAALWRDPELQLALTWRESEHPTEAWARRYAPSFDRAMRFLDASAAERDRQRAAAEREARRQRELRRSRWFLAILGVASILVMVFGLTALRLKGSAESAASEARAQAIRALEQKREAGLQKQIAERRRRTVEQQKKDLERQKTIAERERQIADTQRKLAEVQELRALEEERRAHVQRELAEKQRSLAVEAKIQAELLRRQAQTAEYEARRLSMIAAARALALQSVRLPASDAELSGLLAVQAYKLNSRFGGTRETPEISHALRSALARFRPDVVFSHPGGVRAVAITPDGSKLASGSDDGIIRLFDAGDPSRDTLSIPAFRGAVRSLAIGRDGRSLAAGSVNGTLRLWDLSKPDSPAILGSQGDSPVVALAFHPERPQFAAGRSRGPIEIWSLKSPELPLLALDPQGKRITSTAFSPDGKTLAAGLLHNGVLLWDLEQPGEKPRIACTDRDVRAIAFSPRGGILACGAGRGEILLWEISAGNAILSLQGHASSVNALSFAPQGDYLASASSDGTLKLWNLQSSSDPIVLAGHRSWVWDVAFSPDGTRLFSGSEDRTARAWVRWSGLLVKELCALVNRSLTRAEWDKHLSSAIPFEEAPCSDL